MMPHYQQNTELESLANNIIKAHRPKLEVLKICYMFRDEAPISDGKVIAGMCVRVDDRNWTVHHHDFLIEIAKDIWDQATDEFKYAIMDHELGHVGMRLDESGVPERDEKTARLKTYIRRHDVEDFDEILERHGAYSKNLRQFLEAYAKHKANKKRIKTEEEPD